MEDWNNPVKKDRNRTNENTVQQWSVQNVKDIDWYILKPSFEAFEHLLSDV